MKKLVGGLAGLVGIVFGFAGLGCQATIHEEAMKIKYHSNEIRKIIGAKPGEDYQLFELKKGEPYSAIVWGKDGTKSIVYFDLKKDGEYDHKRTFEIPKKLDLKVLPLPKPELKKYEPKYLPEKRKKGLVVFYEKIN